MAPPSLPASSTAQAHSPPPPVVPRSGPSSLPPRPDAPAATSLAEAREAALRGAVGPATGYLRQFVRSGEVSAERDEARHLLAFVRWSAGDLKGAMASLEPMARRDPVAARRRAELQLQLGQLEGAERSLEEARARWPDDPGLQGARLQLLMETGRAHQAETESLIDSLYDAYARGETRDASSLLAVARATLATRTNGGFHDANAVLEDARAALDPRDVWLGDELDLLHASVFIEKYALDEARSLLEPILARDPWNVPAHTLLGWVALASGDPASARRAAHDALVGDPGAPGAHVILAWSALSLGDVAQATTWLERGDLRAHDQEASALAVATAVAIVNGADPVLALDQALANSTDHLGWRAVPLLADLLGQLRQYGDLEVLLARALVIDPTNPYTLSARGLNLLRLGREDEALKALDAAWRGDRFNARTYNTRALYRTTIATRYTIAREGDVEIRLPVDADPSLRRRLFEEIAAARAALDARYGPLEPRLRVEMFADTDTFSVRTVGVPSFGALGVCFGPVVTMVGPFQRRFNFARVLWHELAHSYALALSDARVPRWFTEGLSEWEAGARDPVWDATAVARRTLTQAGATHLPLGQLREMFGTVRGRGDLQVAYARATLAVAFLMERMTPDELGALLRAFGIHGADLQAALAEIGLSLPELEPAFVTYMREVPASTTARGWHPAAVSTGGGDVEWSNYERMWRRATRAHATGDLTAAMNALDALAARGASSYEEILLRASVLITRSSEGDQEAAQAQLERAAQLAPQRTEHLTMGAALARAQGDVDLELSLVREGWRRDPDDDEFASRALVLAARDPVDPTSLRPLVRRVQAVDPLGPLTFAGLALLEARANPREARRLVEAAAALDPVEPGELFVLARAAERVGEIQIMRDAYARARANPTLSQAVRASIPSR